MKNLRKLFAPLSIVFVAALALTSCKDDDPVVTPPATDIVSVAVANGSFKTLATALTKADLVKTLQGAGPFTVFAPNDAAFTKAGINVDAATKEALTPILTTHVLSGKVSASDVKSGTAKTVNSANDIYLSKNSDGVFINGTIKVIATDVAASNGVIHVIDNVIVPPTASIVGIATSPANRANFTELVELVTAAGLGATLDGASASGFTVFAPINTAFTELYKTVPKATLLLPANKGLLTRVLLYHVVPGRVFSTDLPNVGAAEVGTAGAGTNAGDKLTFDLAGGAKVKGIGSGNSNIVITNLLATNGVVHVIDKVLLPKL